MCKISPLRYRRAFSLVELLVVVAVIGLLLSLGVTSFQGLAGSRKIASSGSKILGLIEAARENAILKRQPTAVVMLLKGGEEARRAFAALEYEPAGTWKQVSRWEFLSDGVLVDDQNTQNALPLAFSAATSPVISPALPGILLRGHTYSPGSDYAYLIFLPDGGLYQAPNCALTVVEGSVSDTTVQRRGDGLNFLQIVINDATGRAKVNRL